MRHIRPLVVALSMFAMACSATRPDSLLPCAALGAAAGAASGAAIGGSVEDNDEETNAAIGAGAGVVLGALAGYAICAMLPEKAAPPPPAPPAAPPAPKAEPVVKKTVVLPGVHFGFDRADLAPAAKDTLNQEVVSELSANPGQTVRIEGHTDAVGNDAYNQSLSQKRAEAVKEYLVSKGIAGSRIETTGFGESKPVASNDTAEGRAENRRVELKVLE
jgi:outer membrane protein OmpA-like peptidoglycan-associated protein